MEAWKTDWTSFLDAVGRAFDEGLDEAAVTARFMHQTVTWIGKVSDSRLDDDDPGVQMTMESVDVQLADGRQSTVDYLFIKMSEENASHWQSVELGTIVRFTTSIAEGHAPFSGIQWSELDEQRGVILIATENSSLVEVVDTTSLS